MDYDATCEQLGFQPRIKFVKINPNGSIGFTAGTPDEIRALLYAVRQERMTPDSKLLRAVASFDPTNYWLSAEAHS